VVQTAKNSLSLLFSKLKLQVLLYAYLQGSLVYEKERVAYLQILPHLPLRHQMKMLHAVENREVCETVYLHDEEVEAVGSYSFLE